MAVLLQVLGRSCSIIHERLSRAAVIGDAEAICKKITTLKQQACFISRSAAAVSDALTYLFYVELVWSSPFE
jgi:hypothetical protein